MDKRATRSAATEQASGTARSTRSTKTSAAAGGSKKSTKPTKGKANEAVAKKKVQKSKEAEKEEHTTNVRKRALKMMNEEELPADEEPRKAKKKRRAGTEAEADVDEQDKPVEDTPEDVEMEDVATKQSKSIRPKPKPAYGKFAKDRTALDAGEEDIVRSLGGGRRQTGDKASGKDKGKAKATRKDEAVESTDESEEGDGKVDGVEIENEDKDEEEREDEGGDGDGEDEAEVESRSEKGEDDDMIEEQDEEDEGDVILLSETKANQKSDRDKLTAGEGETSRRVKVADLPNSVKSLVSAAQNCLCLRIALNSAWTQEASVTSQRLPTSFKLVKDSLDDTLTGRGKNDQPNAAMEEALQLLQDDRKKVRLSKKEREEREAMEAMRKKVYTVVWTCASQMRNELKKKAKQVVEQVFKFGGLSVAQRTEAAFWLLETHPTVVSDGTKKRGIPNFVFGGIEIHFDRKKKLDRERTKVEPKEPFRDESIPELIYQYYGLAGRPDASINAALDDFRKVPLNLIAVSCNASQH
ncbi:uncharacterized protein B0H18DRAFT_1126621 [Fomitopsis serialis]|uniref:uncharacterized protein n=1 Tax=Fomitopsis serialis TaxID=139415 RepID=UPI0020077C6E|nr:uncharacterized protein B0H18DRAFT_1126621 [Neoantrodia serialis]KAH9913044.1 hypothetical protein B0H18DRAFT_1126621 [Neoantrodia serialis]